MVLVEALRRRGRLSEHAANLAPVRPAGGENCRPERFDRNRQCAHSSPFPQVPPTLLGTDAQPLRGTPIGRRLEPSSVGTLPRDRHPWCRVRHPEPFERAGSSWLNPGPSRPRSTGAAGYRSADRSLCRCRAHVRRHGAVVGGPGSGRRRAGVCGLTTCLLRIRPEAFGRGARVVRRRFW